MSTEILFRVTYTLSEAEIDAIKAHSSDNITRLLSADDFPALVVDVGRLRNNEYATELLDSELTYDIFNNEDEYNSLQDKLQQEADLDNYDAEEIIDVLEQVKRHVDAGSFIDIVVDY